MTLTIKSSFNLKEVYEKLSKSLRKLYEYRLFGKRNWKKLDEMYKKELEEYRKNLEKKGEKSFEEIEEEIKKHEYFFQDFKKRFSHLAGSGLKMGEVFNVVWKLEITYNQEKENQGWHPHFHGFWLGYFPKLLLTALWRKVTKGEGKITHMEELRGKKAIKELKKYVVKFWEINSLDEEKILELETVLYGIKRVRHWGLKELENMKEEEKAESLWWVRCELVDRKNLHDVFEKVKEIIEREVEKIRYCRVRIYPYENGDYIETEVYLNQEGALVFSDSVVQVLKNVKRLGDLLPFKVNGDGGGGDWVEKKYREIEKEMKINEKSLPF